MNFPKSLSNIMGSKESVFESNMLLIFFSLKIIFNSKKEFVIVETGGGRSKEKAMHVPIRLVTLEVASNLVHRIFSTRSTINKVAIYFVNQV